MTVSLTHDATVFGQKLFDTGITFVTGVPDSEFKALISDLETHELDSRYLLAAREDSAVALAAGAYFAGDTPMVFMESSGFGNTLDVLTSLVLVYEIPMVLFIAWAGYQGRDVPHHNAIGEVLEPTLQALGIPILEVVLELNNIQPTLDALRQGTDLALQKKCAVAVVGIPAKFADSTKP